MRSAAAKTEIKEILALRVLFLQEVNFQFINNEFHERGWSDSYLLTINGLTVGYGAIQGRAKSVRAFSMQQCGDRAT